MIHLHRWSNWEDVKVADEVQPGIPGMPVFFVRQVIRQQRRCSVCNLVKTRVA